MTRSLRGLIESTVDALPRPLPTMRGPLALTPVTLGAVVVGWGGATAAVIVGWPHSPDWGIALVAGVLVGVSSAFATDWSAVSAERFFGIAFACIGGPPAIVAMALGGAAGARARRMEGRCIAADGAGGALANVAAWTAFIASPLGHAEVWPALFTGVLAGVAWFVPAAAMGALTSARGTPSGDGSTPGSASVGAQFVGSLGFGASSWAAVTLFEMGGTLGAVVICPPFLVIQIAYAMNAAHARAEGERAAELARRRAELLERVAAARRLVARAAEEEREQVAADIHDGAVQDLAGLLFTTRALEARLASGEDVGPEEFAHYVEYCQAVAGTASRELQSMVVELDPPLLAEAGLAAAVGQLVAGVDSGVTCHVDCAHDPGEARLQRLVYRAVREAYRNIVKHAKCQNVWITVAAEADQVVATVRDDGRGFSAEERARRLEQGHNGLGLLERTAALQGARVTIVSAPGQGTTVTLAAPLLGPGRRVGALAAPPLAARTAA